MTGEDAALAHAILGLSLRRWGTLQAFARPLLRNPERPIPLGTQVALAMGLAQLAWLPGVLEHAVVNESVDLAADRTLGFPPHKGLVNAILRKGARNREHLAQRLAELPASLDRSPFVERVLREALDGRQDGVEALWARICHPPRPFFRALDDGPVPPGLSADAHVPGALRLDPSAPFPREWLIRGSGMVQDLSSQALLDFPLEEAPARILDVCAAPGGKTTLLARRWPEAELVAIEHHPARARRLRENLAARKVEAQVEEADAVHWLEHHDEPFDLILVDAPCSGTGTLQKHPELAWIGGALDLARLARTQRRLLEAAAARLAPSGILLYAVCSWLPEESRAHRPWLEARFPFLRPLPLWPGGADQFRPDPLAWEGEGFRAFAYARPACSPDPRTEERT
jgi:16S rRNA (cytosine967-C5)-methyltransferase